MRERRDPAEIEPEEAPRLPRDDDAPPTPRGFARLVGPPEHRPSISGRRLARIAAAALGLAVALAVLYQLGAAAVAWLHRQPRHELAFAEITLDPPPPPYIRLDAPALLEQVRRGAGRPERLAMLETDLGELAAEFAKHTPWVESVQGVTTAYPNRLVVRLSYREPVAGLQVENGSTIYLDREAYVLPNHELVTSEAGPLVRVEGLPGPLETRPGRRVAPPDSEAERLAVRATRLAGFLRDHDAERRAAGAPRIITLHVRPGHRDLMAGAEAGSGRPLWANFGQAPGQRGADPLSTEAKWRQYLDWSRRPGRPSPGPLQYLEFTDDGPWLREGNPDGSPNPSG